jgi:hypothetical protein
MDDWSKQRLAELEASAPIKRAKIAPYVKLPLAWAAKAAAATNTHKAMVWLWLVHRTRLTGSATVAVPNGALAKYGISRKVKKVALEQLEAAGLIAVERRPRRAPIATVLHFKSR